MKRILIINDDEVSSRQLKDYLQLDGYVVKIERNEILDDELYINRAAGNIDIIVIDLEPHKGNGFDSLRKLQKKTAIPIVVLIEGGSDIDRIIGLEIGADDCLSKPFNPRELIARIRAVLRRTRHEVPNFASTEGINELKRLQVGDVGMDLGSRTVSCSGKKVYLTSVEFGLLEYFLKNPGKLIQREILNKEVLGRPLMPYDRSIDVHVSKLRKKLGNEIEECERIKAIRGEGYLYSVIAEASPKS